MEESTVWTSYRLTPPRQRRNELARHEGSKAPRQNNNRTQPPTPLSPTTARELGGRCRCRCRPPPPPPPPPPPLPPPPLPPSPRHTSATTFLSLVPLHRRPRPAVTGGDGVVPGQHRNARRDGTTTTTIITTSSSSSCTGNTATAAAVAVAEIVDVFRVVVVARHGIPVDSRRDYAADADAVVVVARESLLPSPAADVAETIVFVVATADRSTTAAVVVVGSGGGGCSRPRVLAGFHGRQARTPLAHTAAAVHSPRPRSTRRRRRRCCRRRRRRRHHRRHAPTSAPSRQLLASQP